MHLRLRAVQLQLIHNEACARCVAFAAVEAPRDALAELVAPVALEAGRVEQAQPHIRIEHQRAIRADDLHIAHAPEQRQVYEVGHVVLVGDREDVRNAVRRVARVAFLHTERRDASQRQPDALVGKA